MALCCGYLEIEINNCFLKQNDLMKYFREDLHRRLLSTDFKKQVDGIEMLQRALPTIAKDLIEVIDILLKWFVLRFCESNTSCLLKVKFLVLSCSVKYTIVYV